MTRFLNNVSKQVSEKNRYRNTLNVSNGCSKDTTWFESSSFASQKLNELWKQLQMLLNIQTSSILQKYTNSLILSY